MGLRNVCLQLLLLLGGAQVLLLKHQPKRGHFLLDLGLAVPLLLHHLLQLQTFQLHLPLALMVQDLLVGFLHQEALQLLQLLLRLVVRAVLLMAD